MRNIYLITAALASMILASCANEEIVGNEAGTGTTTNGVISFGGLAPAMTRADLYGGDAATKLGNKFVVYGTKHKTAEDNTVDNDEVVFNNFQVAYKTSSAGTTESNTSDWDYVGLPAYDAAITSQGIKYWDYSAAKGHTFYAFSSSNISYPAKATDLVSVTKVTADEGSTPSLYNKGYAVTVKNGASLDNLYFSDRVEVPKEKYDKTVDLTFRNIGTKVRFGFYETIPGYTVKIDKFYIDDANTAVVTDFATMNDAQADGFYASLQNVKTSADQTINVTYYDAGEIINQPKVSNPTNGYNYNIKLGDASTIIGQELATTAATATWVNGTTDGYATVFPFEGNTNPLLVKLDFTMTADDGSADVIHVRGARAIIPAKYVQWKGNFAYTYIFKIFDKTNGTTGEVDVNGDPTDPEGLKPITFDAIVVDITDERQEAITSVSTNSITTYAEGKIVNEYTKGKPIYVVTTDNSTHNVITPGAIGIGAGQARVYKIDKATTEASVLAKLTGSPINIQLDPLSPLPTIETTIPLADGTTAPIANVKFTPSEAGYYAYVYTTTAYVAPTYNSEASGTYDSSKTYYMKSGSGAYFAVTVRNKEAYDANKAQLYTIATAGTPGVYDIKVIKVQ